VFLASVLKLNTLFILIIKIAFLFDGGIFCTGNRRLPTADWQARSNSNASIRTGLLRGSSVALQSTITADGNL